MEEQRVRGLIARHPIAVDLRGLPFERASTITSVLVPKIRRSVLNDSGTYRSNDSVLHPADCTCPVNPNHLDLAECWKGLTHSQATELVMWYNILHECLHDMVRTRLCEDLVRDLLDFDGKSKCLRLMAS